jgi:hypothetical protein
MQFQRQLPAPEPCNCDQTKQEEPPFVEFEQPLMSQTSRTQISSALAAVFVFLIVQNFV